MRKIVFLNAVFGLVGSTAFWACGDTSADSVSADSQIKADALEDLPNCYEKHEGETALLLGDSSVYKCQNGRWVMESTPLRTVPTLDDLLNCTSKSQGDTVQVTAENAVYQCLDGKWRKYRTLVDLKNSLDEMRACVAKREGDLTYVADEHALYQCLDGKWKKIASYMDTVATVKDLPDCSSKNANDSSYVKKENAVYLCIESAWRYLGQLFKNAEKLPNCTERRESEKAFVTEEHESLVCHDEKWNRFDIYDTVESDKTESSSSAKSTTEPEENPKSSSSIANEKISSSSSAVSPKSNSTTVLSSSVAKSSSSVAKSSSSVVVISSSAARSSSSIVKSSSSRGLAVVSGFETWLGVEGLSRVTTGLDNGSKTSGYWFSYDDRNDMGRSSIIWADGSIGVNNNSIDSLANVALWCNGVCGTAILDKGLLTYNPFVGIGFSVAGEAASGDLQPGDASAWGGVCITYASEAAPALELGLGNDVDASISFANPAASLPKSTAGTVKQLAWSDFKQPSWYKGDKKMSGPEAAKQLVAMMFKIQATPANYRFNICAVGPYGGSCPSYCSLPPGVSVALSSSSAKSSSSVAKSSSSRGNAVVSGFETWIGAEGVSRVTTGRDNGSKTSGYWFSYDDSPDYGKSKIVWADGLVEPNSGSLDSLKEVIEFCNGICGTAVLDKGQLTYNPFVGIGFNIVGEDDGGVLEAGDVSAWGGVCISYNSAAAPSLELGLGNDIDAEIGYANPAASLPKSTAGTTKYLTWADFRQPSWYKGDVKMPGPDAAKQLVALRFKIQATSSEYKFKICAIGPYDGSCPSSWY